MAIYKTTITVPENTQRDEPYQHTVKIERKGIKFAGANIKGNEVLWMRIVNAVTRKEILPWANLTGGNRYSTIQNVGVTGDKYTAVFEFSNPNRYKQSFSLIYADSDTSPQSWLDYP